MSTDPSLMATPEELAARKRAAAATAADDTRTAFEKLADSHDHLTDDEMAEKISANPGTLADVLLALWRRVRGDVEPEVVAAAEHALPEVV
jgi:hypothetical protein